MTQPFKHYIITRFNLKSSNSSWKEDKNNNRTLSDEWLEHRIELFKQYCFPSILNQTNKNFKWLIYVDGGTKTKYLKEIESILKNCHEATICKKESNENFRESYTTDIIEFTNASTNYIITSRIDNDDVLHKNYIKTVQDQFSYQNFTAVNFVKIYNYRIVAPFKLFVNYMFSNQFISVIEKINNNSIRGCFSKRDRYWNKEGEIIQISKGVYVLELIHEKNLLNELSGFPVLWKKNLKEFGIKKYQKQNSIFDYCKIWKMTWVKLIITFLKY